MIRNVDRAPAHIQNAAQALLILYRHGELRVRKTKKHGYFTLAVGAHWRMLSRDNGLTWALMSHSDYNTRVDR